MGPKFRGIAKGKPMQGASAVKIQARIGEAIALHQQGRLGALIDSPGFQEFGLAHLSVSELQHAFREFKSVLGQCRFHNCAHLTEPDCAIRDAVDKNQITAERLNLFRQLRSDSKTADAQLQGITQAKERWSTSPTKPCKK